MADEDPFFCLLPGDEGFWSPAEWGVPLDLDASAEDAMDLGIRPQGAANLLKGWMGDRALMSPVWKAPPWRLAQAAPYVEIPSAGWDPDPWRIPARFFVRFDVATEKRSHVIARVTLGLRVEHGVLGCDLVLFRYPRGASITSSAVDRVNVSRLVEMAGMLAATRSGEEWWSGRPYSKDAASTAHDAEDWFDAVRAQARRSSTHQGRKIGPDHYQRVAQVYRAAAATGQPPTRVVQRTFQTSYPTAARWVMTARKKGWLGPTEPGKAGELQREGGEDNGNDR